MSSAETTTKALRDNGLNPADYDLDALTNYIADYRCSPAELDLRTLRECADMHARPGAPATWQTMSETEWWAA